MEKPVPMDRLLCGDVGYGKTEVALRAVMKCVLDGKQAAILVPTTVLARQHYRHRHEPLAGLPGEGGRALAASARQAERRRFWSGLAQRTGRLARSAPTACCRRM